MELLEKQCTRCRKNLPFNRFSPDKKMRLGLKSWCKQCCSDDSVARAKLVPEHTAAKLKKWKLANPDKVRASNNAGTKRDRRRNPEKSSARSAVAHAIEAGKLKRGLCEVCGTSVDVEAHHEDYSKPLSINWLCRKCHLSQHKMSWNS